MITSHQHPTTTYELFIASFHNALLLYSAIRGHIPRLLQLHRCFEHKISKSQQLSSVLRPPSWTASRDLLPAGSSCLLRKCVSRPF